MARVGGPASVRAHPSRCARPAAGRERIADLRYGDDRRNRLDVYRHRSAPEGGPTLVYFHGGGYFSGRKNREARPLLYRLASQGWVCVSANYRLRPDAGFIDHLTDAKRVIAWTREHGHEYGSDTDTLVMAGSSAGAHLTSLCALTQNDPAYQPGFESADTSIAAAVCLYGYFGDYYGHDEGSGSSPLAHVRADAPPFFIVHGDADTLVPVREARHFAGVLRGVSDAPVVYAELPGAQHAFDLFHSLRFDRVVYAVESFAAWVRCSPEAAADRVADIAGESMPPVSAG
ncbi:alpha/beta hydrolase [Actinomadura sp. BRA 177]|uniref:alpha/beta hydrolase n=1 Tax=Actinomadura sp. BRA 177 TaxID=2745202 RepID=UPI001C3C6555|nr:alpha/beta hydrolase [Actinomadura sp. BRA 177]